MSLYTLVTSELIKALEAGVIPWRQPWTAQHPTNIVSRKPYRGINRLILSWTSCQRGFASPHWMTFKQAAQLGGGIRKGQHGTPILFWTEVEDPNDKTHVISRYYRVFNADQCEGLMLPSLEIQAFEPIQAAERLLAAMPQSPEIRYGGHSAFYSPREDRVHVPSQSCFENAESFFATVYHELAHATGHPSRLGRFDLQQRMAAFGSEDYSREELVAELGSAFLCAEAGISASTLPSSASYLQSWLKVLKAQPTMLVQAAGQAQKAADWVLGGLT